mmetsp:Transcript_30263/g.83494  ORF Transcript_30263/g.83494 Transcript_30263/m.83494 type:complete len:112 (-) Transcript_30263:163-498(-)
MIARAHYHLAVTTGLLLRLLDRAHCEGSPSAFSLDFDDADDLEGIETASMLQVGYQLSTNKELAPPEATGHRDLAMAYLPSVNASTDGQVTWIQGRSRSQEGVRMGFQAAL